MRIPENEYEVVYIPMELVYSDDSFNCRGSIPTIEVTDLAQDIQKNKLQFPIAVQPAEDVSGGLPDGREFRIVAGHRRFKAWTVLFHGWREGDLGPGNEPLEDDSQNPYAAIPCMVKCGLSEVSARILNLGENLKRKDLNILQEAKAIQHLQEAGVPRDHVATELGVSSNWVQVRYNLLTLPEEIQQEAAAGLINQLQVKQLFSLKDTDKQFAAVRKIKDAKSKGEKIGHVGKPKPQNTNIKKERKRSEIFKMIDILATATGYGLHTRSLAWASGQITTEDFFGDIREFCERKDMPKPRLPEEF